MRKTKYDHLVVDTESNYVQNIYDTRQQATVSCEKLNQKENKYEIIDFPEYSKRERVKWVTGIITKITEKQFWEMLEILPPIEWYDNGLLETFCMSEMMAGNYTEQYANYNGKYYCKMVDVTDKTTWITITDLEKLA